MTDTKKECCQMCSIVNAGINCCANNACPCHAPTREGCDWERLDVLLYDFADRATDRDGDVESKDSIMFQRYSEEIKTFIRQDRQRLVGEIEADIQALAHQEDDINVWGGIKKAYSVLKKYKV